MSETTKYTEPCGMYPARMGVECGKPATVGWRSEETRRLVPICDDCIRATGTQRRVLTPLTEPADAIR